jgi:two-component system, sensor histidine kinase and response regulator
MTDSGTLVEPRLVKAESRLKLTTQLLQSSLWEFVLTDGLVESSYLDEGAVYWDDQRGSPPGTDFVSSMAALGVLPEDRLRLTHAIQACVNGEAPGFHVELRLRQADGSVRWHLVRGRVSRDTDGTARSFTGIGTDVTELKRGEEAARKAEESSEATSVDMARWKRIEEDKREATERLALATQLSNVFVWIFDLVDGAFERASVTFINIWESLGYEAPPVHLDAAASMALVIVPEDLPAVMRAVEATLSGETPQFDVECRIRHKDGAILWSLARGIVTRDAAGIPLRFLGTSVDITELKRVESESRRNKERLELAVLGSNACTWDYELEDGSFENARATYTNVWELLGYESGEGGTEFVQHAEALIPEEERQEFIRLTQSFLDGQTREWSHELRVRHKDGSDRWHLTRGVAERDATGRATRFTGSSVDITDRKLIERALRESEYRWRSLSETLPLLVFTAAADGTIEYLGTQATEYTGRTEQEMLGSGWAESIHPDDLERTGKSWFEALEKEQIHEVQHRIRRADGEYRWFTTRAAPARDSAGSVFKWVGTCTDITSSKQLEAELRRAKELLELSIRGSNVAIFDFDMPDGRIENSRQTMINVWETLGYDPATAPSEFAPGAVLAIDPEDLARVQYEIGSYLAGGGAIFEAEYRVRHRDGSVLWRLARGTALRDEDGKPIRFMGSFFDITDLKRVEDKLRDSELRWRTLVETVPHLVFTTRANGEVDHFSAQTLAFLGRPESELLGSAWTESIHPDDRAHIGAEWAKSIELQLPHETHHRVRRSDGEYRWMTTRAIPLRDDVGRVLKWFGTSTDITTMKQLEAELRHAKDLLELGVRGSKVSIFEFDMPDGELENARQTMINLWESLGYDPAMAPTRFGPGSELAIHPDDLAYVRAEVNAYLSGARQDFEIEFRVRHREGAVIWHLARGVAYRDADGKPLRFIGSFVDITDKKQVEERHRESEQRWQNLAESLPLLVWTTNTDGIGEYYSRQTQEFTGLTEIELIEGWLTVIHPDDHAPTLEAWAKAIATESFYTVDFRVRRVDGIYRWFTSRATPLRDGAGRVFRWVGTCTDIEERKQLAENLQESERRWQSLAEMVPHFVWSASADGMVDYYSAQATAYTGLPESELQGFSWAQTLHPEDRDYTVKAWLEALEQRRPHSVEHRVRMHDGTYQWFSTRAVPILDGAGHTVRWFGTNTNVEGFKRLEADLRHARDLLELGVRGSKVSIFEFDMPDGDLANARQTMVNLWESLGYDPAAAPAKFGPASELVVHPDDLTQVRLAVNSYLSGAHPNLEIDFRVRHRDGRVFWHLARGVAHRDAAGMPIRFIGSFIDITDKKHAEERHREIEQRWQTLAETLPQLIWSANGDGAGDYFSTQTEQFTGVPESELVGAGWLSVVHPDDRERTVEVWMGALRTERLYEVDFRIRRADGVYRWVTTRAAPLRDGAGRISKWYGTCTDIEDGKQFAERLRESEQRWQRLAELVPQQVWTANADGAVDYYNARATENTGIPELELHGFGWAQTIHPDDLERTVEAWRIASVKPVPYEIEHRVRRYDGQYQWFSSRATPILDDAGRVVKWFGTDTNISGLKHLEGELRHAKELLELGVRGSKVSIFEYDMPDGNIENARPTMINLWESLGYDPALAPNDFRSGAALTVHPDDLERVRAETDLYLSGRRADFEVEFRVLHNDGSVIWYLSRGLAYRDGAGKPVRFIGSFVDITDKKEVEERHRESELRWRTLAEALPLLVWSANAEGVPDYFSAQTVDYTGASEADLCGAGWLNSVHPDDRARGAEVWAEAIATQSVYEVDFRIRRADGLYRWFTSRARPTLDNTGRVSRWFGTCTDIEDRRRLAEEVRASEQRWRSHAESLPQFVFTTTPDGTADYFSATTSAYTGLSQSDLVGWAWGEAIHPDDLERTVETWKENRFHGRPHQVEHRIRGADGVYRWFTTRAAAVWDGDGNVVAWFGTCTEIENLKQLEADLRHAKDLLVLGVSGSKVSIFDFDMPDGKLDTARITLINFWESLGYDPATAPSDFRSCAELVIHPDDLKSARAEVHSYLSGGSQDFEIEFRVRHYDGSVLWHLTRGVAFRDSEGTPIRFIGSGVDITDKKRVEERLRASEQLWRSLAEMLPQFVFTTTPDGTADYFSSRTSQFTGRTQAELIGWAWAAAIHPDDIQDTSKTWLDNVASRRQHEVNHRIRGADGEYRWFMTRAAVLLDDDGNVVRWFGTCTDVENLKQLEADLRQAKERLELAIRSANLCIWEYDMPDGKLENSRETLTNVWESFGYDASNAPPTVAAVIHPEDLQRVNEHIMACLSGKTPAFEAEHRVRHNDGSYHWILGRGVALRDSAGRPTRFVGTSVDINDIKRIEADLLRAREAAESANRAKDEFLANVSHEIRTPMNAILGMTELALDSARTEHQRQLLSTVRTAARNLLNIINDLLDFSKIAAGKLALDEADFSLRSALTDTVRALAPRAHRKGLELISQVRPDVPDFLFGDAGRLRQVLMNLVGNALKFTAQGEVVVSVELLSKSDDALLLSFRVRDTGIGIAREKQVAIFRAFEQEDASTTRKYGGTGLGLTISSQLVALMGGEISVQSEPGQGSAFGFTARFTLSSGVVLGAAAVSHKVLEDLHVLVVGDSDTNRQVLTERLTEWRMRPVAVDDAASALGALVRGEAQGVPFALVLLDARIPDLDGIALAAEIQARFGSAQRLILLSSNDDPVLLARSREAGIKAYLLKPVRHSELLETIWAVMNTPADSMPDRDAGTAPAAATVFRRVALRILVAEDNDLNVALLRELLTPSGHSTEFASDGRTALALNAAEVFDLLLLDLHMPEMDGFEVVQAIRHEELTTGRHLPIIALTARSSKRDRERCLAAGMDDFLSKPIEADALWAAIDRMVLAFPPTRARQSRLIDQHALSRACGGRQAILIKLCEVFQSSLPDHMLRVRVTLSERDLQKLSKAAHMLYGTLAAFSTIAGALALTLEDLAKRGDVESCAELVDRLEVMCSELIADARSLAEPGRLR